MKSDNGPICGFQQLQSPVINIHVHAAEEADESRKRYYETFRPPSVASWGGTEADEEDAEGDGVTDDTAKI